MKVYEVVNDNDMTTQAIFSTKEFAISHIKKMKFGKYAIPPTMLVYETEVDSGKTFDWTIVYRSTDDPEFDTE